MADPQAEGNPKGTGRAPTCGTLGAVEHQAGEPALALVLGMGDHRAADEEEGLDRFAAADDEAGGVGVWSEDVGDGARPRRTRDLRPKHPYSNWRGESGDAGPGAGAAPPRCRHGAGAGDRSFNIRLSPLGRSRIEKDRGGSGGYVPQEAPRQPRPPTS